MARRTCLCGVTLTVHDEGVTLKAHDSPPVPLTATQAQGAMPGAYTGPYEAVPALDAQTLPTANRLLTQDVTVEEIPRYRTSNLGGGYTVVIAQG